LATQCAGLYFTSVRNFITFCFTIFVQVEQVLVVRVSAGLKEWTRCLLGMADETADNTDAPTDPKPGGDPILQVNMTTRKRLCVYCF